MLELFIAWRLFADNADREINDESGYGTIMFIIFSQLVLWPITLVYIAKTYLDVPLRRAILATAVIVVWLLWLFPLGFAIAGIITMLATAWKVFEELDMI